MARSFGSAFDFLASRLVHIALMMLSLQFLPLPKITQQGHCCLLSVSSRVCSLDCLEIKALENRPREVSLSLNHTDYITDCTISASFTCLWKFVCADTPCSWLRKFGDYLDRYQNNVFSVKLSWSSLDSSFPESMKNLMVTRFSQSKTSFNTRASYVVVLLINLIKRNSRERDSHFKQHSCPKSQTLF